MIVQADSTASLNGPTTLSATGDREARKKQQSSSIDEPEYTFGDRVRIRIAGYWASFLLIGVIIPIVFSTVLVVLYLSFPELSKLLAPIASIDPNSDWALLLLTNVSTIVLWLVLTLIWFPFATAQSANPGSYGLLKSRLCQLRAKLGIEGSDHDLRMLEKKCTDIKEAIKKIVQINRSAKDADDSQAAANDDCNQAAVKTALACYIDIRKMLYQCPAGFLWAFGSGYCSAWRLLHQAEEAIIEFDSTDEIICGAMGDKLALQDSVIHARDELLDTLIQAATVLQPAAEVYFKEHQPNKDSATLASLKEIAFQEFLSQHGFASQKHHSTASDKTTARAALRRVRRAINSLRDGSLEGLLRARNRLLASTAITGIVTHVLLCVAILTTNNRSAIIAATAFYLVGAVIGLFGRFYRESTTGTTVDDFGFSTARLIATPLLSGLAGIGGVLLTVMLTTLDGSALGYPSKLGLEQIFHLDPQFLLIAAIFGLAPNLLITGLQNTAKKYESDIQSSKLVELSAADGKA